MTSYKHKIISLIIVSDYYIKCGNDETRVHERPNPNARHVTVQLDSIRMQTACSSQAYMTCHTRGGTSGHNLPVLFGCLLAISLIVNGMLLWRLRAARKELKEARRRPEAAGAESSAGRGDDIHDAESPATLTTTTTRRRTNADGEERRSGSNVEAFPLTVVATAPDSDPTAATSLLNGGQHGTNGCLAGVATMPNGIGVGDQDETVVVT